MSQALQTSQHRHAEPPEHAPNGLWATREEDAQIQIVPPRTTVGYRFWTTSQRALAAFLLLISSPILVTMWVLVRTTSKGPFLFSQVRAGLNDRPIRIYKVRTMCVNSEKNEAYGFAVTSRCPAVTPVGRFFRYLKLDELPQLWAIVRGQMLFVGPRPIASVLDRTLRQHIPGFANRYRLKPGLTNLGQISIDENQTGDGVIDDWSQRFEGELHHMLNRTVWYELTIIVMTILFVMKKLVRFMRIRTSKHTLALNA
ncbi:MAG: sugar transferase [Planctomycetota bacterium]|jgi:lipopolysaccharide/colanic/teichoic acid biosynthesis glycosyltransferase